ncbi:MAG: hypothetical protein COS14_14155 [Bacteroidetes bacterium CG02_land_8_20_14_3_00_31_25]|nr:hypothetical protein [Bacteroidota bacterium]PIV57564.1 MAG: hypothetical protein COS14_14155 [Bacteroidetes bacterium CG02_land_8_20_14_3_00_31_25]PIX36575.1 MAG: hypothetical protein COZ59_00355 [Bacteroidetes bacterium CG_4_8_14_3_um_filter_31_14]PIY05967.1 MAG: hypothetical protein COZ21_03570 [Bacteroidetes bacterium CG_4_10_14_3_um_filter_31_20]
MVKIFLMILFVFVIVSCNKDYNVDCTTYDYSNCNTIEPTNADVTITITKQTKDSKVPVWLYKGKYGNSQELIFFDTILDVETKFNLQLNNDYYAIAKYYKNEKTIYAIDGSYLKKVGKAVCDSTCWIIKGNIIDLRLKN